MCHSSSVVRNEKECLEQMITGIVQAISPEKIYMRESLLLIVLTNPSQKPLSEYKTLMAAVSLSEAFHYSLFNAGDLERLLQQGHLFYSTLCVEEHLVYDSGAPVLSQPLHRIISKTAQKAVRDFTAGYGRSRSFLRGATFYLAQDEPAMSAFMLHQAAEQVVRAILFALSGQEIKTHTLAELNQHLKRYGLLQDSFLSGKTGEDRRLLERLEKAYTCARYTNHYEISLDDLFQLLAHIKRLLKELKDSFEELLKSFAGASVSYSIH